jgi:predicted AAA+ superfamily ATPase
LSSDKEITEKDLKLFLPLSKVHKKAKKSFVIVASDLDFNAVSDKLAVVPSLLEAHDIIEMEEIERDLGF